MSRSTSRHPRRRRVRHDIIMEILRIAKDGERKTNLMVKVGLSYTLLKSYLSALEKADFITEKSGVWKTTEKGFHVIEACNICHRLIKEVPQQKKKEQKLVARTGKVTNVK